MTNSKRRAELQAQLDREWGERAREQARKADLSMFMRIEEADASEDVKDILHRLAQALALEE